jgi:dTDP-4-dehydrorhamnose reductase
MSSSQQLGSIYVIGSNGQLAQCLKKIEPNFIYTSRNEVDLLKPESIATYFSKVKKPTWILNLSAYTQVDKAEDEPEIAMQVNGYASAQLASLCENYIYVSTDYVFSGDLGPAWLESDAPAPLNSYGKSKLMGEHAALRANPQSYIFRTSWLYSEFGVNFVRRMLELAKTRDTFSVVADQRGSPTYAYDLALILSRWVSEKPLLPYGIYHFSNSGDCTWYEFTKEIFRKKGISAQVQPILSKDYPAKAIRPTNSILNCEKIQRVLDIDISHWQSALDRCLQKVP